MEFEHEVFILFYLWIVPLVIGLIFFGLPSGQAFKKVYPGYIMIGLAAAVFAVCYLIGQPYLGNFFGGTMLFGTLLPFMAAAMKKRNNESQNPGSPNMPGLIAYFSVCTKPADSQIGFPDRQEKSRLYLFTRSTSIT
ncbi:hypothetical protein PO124_25965 [Bacillus licheniformis]|nr:hypothetical protein [Bacillus licheniformis]